MLAAAGQVQYWISGAAPGQEARVTAPITHWRPSQWHHVAVTWTGINSGKPEAEICLYLDGKLAHRRGGLRLDVGLVAEVLDLGRDSDGSPDYAHADVDEFYVYGRCLTAEEILRAVEMAKGEQADVDIHRPSPLSSKERRGNSAWKYRCRAQVDPRRAQGKRTAVRMPWDVQQDLRSLDVFGMVDPASIRVVPGDGVSNPYSPEASPVPLAIEPGAIVWQIPVDETGGAVTESYVYFDVARFDTSAPLYLKPPPGPPDQATSGQRLSLPDFASETYQDAWDFDDGDFEGIDGWGRGAECLKNRQVKDGILSFDVSEDPYFIWGDMWSGGHPTQRPVAIDLKRYPVLEMKVRQSCPSAEWEVMARAGSPHLMQHKFHVTGTGWWIVRVDLVREARFGSVLDAFRIDPTARIQAAHVEIDWNAHEARREPVETIPASPSHD